MNSIFSFGHYIELMSLDKWFTHATSPACKETCVSIPTLAIPEGVPCASSPGPSDPFDSP